MFLAHSFRLRGPWQCECTLEGGVRWSRGFHRPTGLEDDDDLWLVCSGLPPGAAVTMNGQRLPLPPDVRQRRPSAAASMGATGVPPVRRADGLITPSTGDTPAAHRIPSLPNQFEVTSIVADANRIEILVPSGSGPTVHNPQPAPSDLKPQASSLKPSPFPYDVRLGIVGHS